VIRLADVIERPDMITEIPVEVVPSLLGELETLRARLWTAILRTSANPLPADPADTLLDARAVAKALDVSTRWIYRHHRQLPFARPMSKKTLRFSSLGLQGWIAQQHGRQRRDLSKMKS
jgi:predicted DNA-binding transcriptional regulator AlpA